MERKALDKLGAVFAVMPRTVTCGHVYQVVLCSARLVSIEVTGCSWSIPNGNGSVFLQEKIEPDFNCAALGPGSNRMGWVPHAGV